MISNKILAAHIIRLYVADLLMEQAGVEKINGLVPVVSVDDEPELSDSNMPYAIYGYAENETRVEQIREGVFSLRIIAPTFAQLGRMSNVVALGFESTDIATESLNLFSTTFGD